MNTFTIPADALTVTVAFGPNANERDVRDCVHTVGCPYCKALPDRWCHDPRTGRIDRVHSTRVSAYRRRQRRRAR